MWLISLFPYTSLERANVQQGIRLLVEQPLAVVLDREALVNHSGRRAAVHPYRYSAGCCDTYWRTPYQSSTAESSDVSGVSGASRSLDTTMTTFQNRKTVAWHLFYALGVGLAHWAINPAILSSMRLSTVRRRRMEMPFFARMLFFKASRAA